MDRKSFLGWVALLAILGCQDQGASRDAGPEVPLELGDIDQFSNLARTKQSPLIQLRAELERIESQQRTPERLVNESLPKSENAADVLAKLFDESELREAGEKARQLLSPVRFDHPPSDLAVALRRRFDDRLAKLPAALRRPRCDFQFDFRRGFFASASFIEVVELCVRLEAIRVAGQLGGSAPSGAVESIRVMFHLLDCLAAQKHVEARLTAANRRAEMLVVIQAVVRHPGISPSDLAVLARMLEEQLDTWPNDAEAWIGDQAMALHSYEVIRAGYLDLLLTEQEAKELNQESFDGDLEAHVLSNLDQDELYYLQTMEKIIALCEEPYYSRRSTFTAIRQELDDLRKDRRFPLIAGRLFLPGIEQGQQIQAQDRARCEAWAIGLARAAGQKQPPYTTNPSTGFEYQVVIEAARVTVNTGVGEAGQITVPRPEVEDSQSEPALD